jgi:hypothetical protein
MLAGTSSLYHSRSGGCCKHTGGRRAPTLCRALPATFLLVPLLACESGGTAQVDPASIESAIPPGPITYPIVVSRDSRRILDGDGRVVFFHGEAAWSLVVQLTLPEAEQYLDDRRAKGFNAIYLNLIEHAFSNQQPPWLNRLGEPPFRDTLPDGALDLTTPNEAYWSHVDTILELSRARSIVVIAFPAYLGFNHGAEGWAQDLRSNGLARVAWYGAWLGGRYGSQPNLIWSFGGDSGPITGHSDLTDHVNALAWGIRSKDPKHLMTAHSSRNRSAADDYNQPWLDINSTYAAYAVRRGPPTIASRLRVDYERRPARPFLFLEGHYENEHGVRAAEVRAQAYWAVLGGASGHFYGNWPTWAFGAAAEFGDDRRLSWKAALRLEGAQDMVHLGDLLRSRCFEALIPDYERRLIAGYRSTPTASDHLGAAWGSDGSTAIVYLQNTHRLIIDLRVIRDSLARVWWFDPKTGKATHDSDVETEDLHVFVPPQEGDWVLVIDALSKHLPPPGTPTGTAHRCTHLTSRQSAPTGSQPYRLAGFGP